MKCKEEDREIEAFRCKLDPTYHSTYSYSRKPIHCSIIRDILSKSKPHEGILEHDRCPQVIFTTGPIGAGKSHLLQWMISQDIIPASTGSNYVLVNMDEIRDMLPESKFYRENLPEEYGEMTQREAGSIAELLVHVALHRGYDVIIDSAMIDLQWQVHYIEQLRREYPRLRIGLIHVTASRDIIQERVMKRNQSSHRFVPLHIMNLYFEKVT